MRIQSHLHHTNLTYVPAKLEVATSNDLGLYANYQ